MSNKVTYKNYNMNQLQIPMDITDWIEENHISKLINQVVEGIDEKILRQSYKGGGRCSYHPKMMSTSFLDDVENNNLRIYK